MKKEQEIILKKIGRSALDDLLKNASWYHTIDFFDHLHSRGVYDHRKVINNYGFPKSLLGKNVLDVGCSDGFFSFEFEKRGSSSVLAVDMNKFDGTVPISPSPAKKSEYEQKYAENYRLNSRYLPLAKNLGLENVHRFLLAKKLLVSSVEYQNCSIYDLEKLNKKFDFVFCGNLIEHLKNPIEASEKLRNVCTNFCIVSISTLAETPWWGLPFSLHPRFKNRIVTYWGDQGGSFFHFSAGACRKLLIASGFKKVKIYKKFSLKNMRTKKNNQITVFHCWVN